MAIIKFENFQEITLLDLFQNVINMLNNFVLSLWEGSNTDKYFNFQELLQFLVFIISIHKTALQFAEAFNRLNLPIAIESIVFGYSCDLYLLEWTFFHRHFVLDDGLGNH